MSRPEIVELAGALRRHVHRTVERKGRGRYEGVVLSVVPLVVDVAGLDAQLVADDLTFGNSAEAYLGAPGNELRADDVLVLIEADDGDFDVVDVLRD